MNNIFIEAESFKNKGGWVIDTASMETIHSAYLMAHGMGKPVEDAFTDVICTNTVTGQKRRQIFRVTP